MPAVSRKDVDSAGGKIQVGSPNVNNNNSPVVRIGDAIASHGRNQHNHPIMATGSPNVFVNNIPICRDGDTASCGHKLSGSGTVFANGP